MAKNRMLLQYNFSHNTPDSTYSSLNCDAANPFLKVLLSVHVIPELLQSKSKLTPLDKV